MAVSRRWGPTAGSMFTSTPGGRDPPNGEHRCNERRGRPDVVCTGAQADFRPVVSNPRGVGYTIFGNPRVNRTARADV